MPVRLFLSSGDLMADRRFDFARDLRLKGDLAAADLLLQAAELAAHDRAGTRFIRSSKWPRWWKACAASPTPAPISFSPPMR
jgi:hypothetical protein